MDRFFKIAFLVVITQLAFFEKAIACHGTDLVNISGILSGGNLIINAESDAATCGCDPYSFEIELTCINSAYTGSGTHFSASMVKSGCNQEPYPTLIIPIGSLCPGTTYKWRAREHVMGVTPDNPYGPWSVTYTFTTPGVITPITASAVASPAGICIPNSSTLTASASGGCGSGYIYSWDNGLGSGSSVTVSPTVTTTYNVTVTDQCSGFSQTAPVTVTVGQAPNGGMASASPASVCPGGSTTITLASYIGNIQWQTAPGPVGPWTNSAGANSSTFALGPLNATTFVRALVTGTCGGSVYSNTLVVQVIQKPTVTVNSPSVCDGQPATITATPSSGTGTYSWSNGASTQSVTVSPAVTSNFTVVYTLNGCSSDPAVSTVTVKPKPIVTIPPVTICSGETALLQSTSNPSGGTTIWSTGQGGSSINVSPNVNTVYYALNTLNGCTSDTSFVTVTVKPIPVITLYDTAICEGSSVTLNSSVSIPGGNYSWNPSGSATPALTVTPLATTTYTLNYSANGCNATPAEATVTVNEYPTITIADQTICEGETATLSAVPDISGGTYSWNTLETSASISVSPNVSTGYSAVYTVNGCTSSSATAMVTVHPLPQLTVNNATICLGQSTTLTATPDIAGGTYLWLPGNEITASITISPTTTSTYTVIYSLNGCTASASSVVTVNFLTGVSAGNDVLICPGDSVLLTATGANNYLWSNGSTSASIMVSPIATTSYFLTGSSGACSGLDTVIVNVPSDINLSSTETHVLCNGLCTGQINLNVSGGLAPFSYTWSNNVSNTSSAANLCSGQYDIIVTDSVGCTDSISVALNEPNAIVYNFTVDSANCFAACDGSAQVFVSGGNAPYSYLWDNGDTGSFADNLCSGNVSLIITDNNNCVLNRDTTIYQPLPLSTTVTPTDTLICIGSSAVLNGGVTGGTAPYTYQWSNGSNSSDINVTPVADTQYSFSASDANGCNSVLVFSDVHVRDSIHVSVNHPIEICTGSSAAFTANATGGDGLYNYSWQPGSQTGTQITVSPAATTTYTLTASDACGSPSANEIFTLYVIPAPVVNFTTDTTFVCTGECIQFNDASAVQPGSLNTYTWSFSDGSTDTGTQFQKCFPVAGAFDVSLHVVSSNGCQSSLTVNNAVTAGAVPEVDFNYSPSNPTDIEPLVTFQNTSLYSDLWSWNFGDNSAVSNEQNPQHNFADTGIYCVTLHAENTQGCSDSIIKCLRVEPELTVYIPNTFTPDGDEHNEIFQVYMSGAEIENFEMRIFNRWGNQVYYTRDPLSGWDGKNSEGNGIDTYVYRVIIKDLKGYERVYIGNINLIR